MDTQTQPNYARIYITTLATIAVAVLIVAVYKIVTFEPAPDNGYTDQSGFSCPYFAKAITSGTADQEVIDAYERNC